MKRVNSDALQEVDRALGITGQRGSEQTDYQDGILDQVLDVAPLVRRGRTLGISEGIFEGILQNTHLGATTLLSTIAPYDVPADVAIPPWPQPVPRGLDIWVIKATVHQRSGGGTFKGALFANLDDAAQGWGVTDGGTPITFSPHSVLVNWDALETDTFPYGVLNGGVPTIRPFRILRGTSPGSTLSFSSTSSANAAFVCQILLGLFPTGLGQDVSV